MHEFLVLALRVVDHCQRRRGDCRQARDFARMVHAHLDHGRLVLLAQAEQGQWHADFIIQVAARGQARFFAKGRRQDGRNHLLDGGLAIAAGDANDGQVEAAAPEIGDAAQRDQGIGHHDGRYLATVPACGQALDHHGGDATGGHLLKEVMGVETLAAQGDEQRAGLGAAAVGGNAVKNGVAHQLRAVQRRHQFCQGGAHQFVLIMVRRADRASCAWSASENGSFLPLISW